jgi:hypothetical protein
MDGKEWQTGALEKQFIRYLFSLPLSCWLLLPRSAYIVSLRRLYVLLV